MVQWWDGWQCMLLQVFPNGFDWDVLIEIPTVGGVERACSTMYISADVQCPYRYKLAASQR
jgi:hypothetical protein